MELPPFLSSAPLQGDPPCTWDDFLLPQLRRFPHANAKLRKPLGHGIEGCVARVQFDCDPGSCDLSSCDPNAQFALKIFFDSTPTRRGTWWPLQREARNVAILEKVQAGLRQSDPAPIHVPAKRTHRLDCLRCLYAFSEEGRASRVFDAIPNEHVAAEKIPISVSSTRIRRCFGWTRVQGAQFRSLNKIIEIDVKASSGEGQAQLIMPDRDYFAIVYEYIPETPLELDAVQAQLDFFYRIGFESCQGSNIKNWQGPGILLDFGDYEAPVVPLFGGAGAFHKGPSAEFLLHRAEIMARPSTEWDEWHKRYQEGRLTEEEKLAEKRRRAAGRTAEFIERGYRRGQWDASYFVLYKEELPGLGLDEDPLASIGIRAIEPNPVLAAWKVYSKQKKEYLARVAADAAADTTSKPESEGQ